MIITNPAHGNEFTFLGTSTIRARSRFPALSQIASSFCMTSLLNSRPNLPANSVSCWLICLPLRRTGTVSQVNRWQSDLAWETAHVVRLLRTTVIF